MKTSANWMCLGIMLVLVSCQHKEADSTEEKIVETHSIGDADYRVYDAVLTDLVEEWHDDPLRGPVTQLVLWGTTGLGPLYGVDPGFDATTLARHIETPAGASSIADGFISANSESCTLENRFESPVPLALLSRDEIWKLLTGSTWEQFYTSYPGGLLVELSAIGFSTDSTYALVYAGGTRGPLEGSGHVYLLKRDRSDWAIAKKAGVWIS